MRITLDTAILVRANTRADGPPKRLIDIIRDQEHPLMLSDYILGEVKRVLQYPRMQARYGLSGSDLAEYIAMLRAFAHIVEPAQGPPIVPQDPNDDPILYTAVAANADVLCTVDKHFYDPSVLSHCSRRDIAVMSDIDLLDLLRR